jgi:hypothetical protein
LLLSIINWLLYSFFMLGAAGGVIYLVRLMFWNDKRIEVHHRYYQTPVYYPPPSNGRPGDMAQDDPEPDRAA